MAVLLRNSNGKVLKTDKGNALISNYNFGNGFKGKLKSLLNNQIRIYNPLGLTLHGLTLQFFIKYARNTVGSPNDIFALCHAKSPSYLASFTVGCDRFGGVGFSKNMLTQPPGSQGWSGNLGGLNYSFLLENKIDLWTLIFRPSGGGFDMYLNNSLRISNSFTGDMTYEIWQYYSLNFGYGRNNTNLMDDMGEFRLYNRELSFNEIKYAYNNGNGRDPLSSNSLLYRIKFSQAEILDFSELQDDSDLRVGVKNFGSLVNGHAEIIDLPAGTLEEKRDWANANLFVNFL